MTDIRFLALVAAIALGGCTSIVLNPIARSENLTHVCIEENPRVDIANLLYAIRNGFERHGISTEVFTGDDPKRCEFVLTYTARESVRWGEPRLTYAELRIARGRRLVGTAQYRSIVSNRSAHFADPEDKLDPVIDELLINYPPVDPASSPLKKIAAN